VIVCFSRLEGAVDEDTQLLSHAGYLNEMGPFG
jgi:hypothetical protein